MCRWIKNFFEAKHQYSKCIQLCFFFKIKHYWILNFPFPGPCPIPFPYWLPANLGWVHKWSPSKGTFVVHAWYLFLKVSADVYASAFQCGGEQAVGDTERLWMQVKVLHLKEEKGKTQPRSLRCRFKAQQTEIKRVSGETRHLFKGLQPCLLPHSCHVL